MGKVLKKWSEDAAFANFKEAIEMLRTTDETKERDETEFTNKKDDSNPLRKLIVDIISRRTSK